VLVDYIALSEGRRNRLYLDTRGIQTIGIGFNLTRSGARAAITAVGANFDRIFSGTDTSSLDVLRRVLHREVHRPRDEAILVDLPVERVRALQVGSTPNPDGWTQRRAKKSPSAIGTCLTDADRRILIGRDDDARLASQV
jgi:hypothetical protein